MELTSRLTRPFIRHKKLLVEKINSFVGPIQKSLADLRGKMPSSKGFAGSEDLADDSVKTTGILERLKNFKNSLKEMSDFQKLLLLTIAVCLPAGILISTILVGVIKKHKKK